jgi:hypothetical protein
MHKNPYRRRFPEAFSQKSGAPVSAKAKGISIIIR